MDTLGHRRGAGFTLLELLFTLFIFCTITFTAIPGFIDLVKRTELKVQTQKIHSLLHTARSTALHTNRIVTICGSSEGQACERSWSKNVLIFADYNGNGELDNDDEPLRFEPLLMKYTSNWNAFQRKKYLQFMPSGHTNHQNGNLLICPKDGDLRYARQVVVNTLGRVRMATDTDGNGIANDPYGDDLTCN